MRFASITDQLGHLGSQKWALHLRARELADQGVDILELTIGEPDIAPDPALLRECQMAMNAGRYRYSIGRGEPGLVAALAKKYSLRTGRPVSARNVLCFPGTQSALYATLMGLVQSGDEVLVGDPLYATYEGVIRATGAEMVSVPLHPDHGFRMGANDLEAAITPKARVLLLNNPHNPTGAVLTHDEISAIGEVCQNHDLTIVCDEVYEQLIYDGDFASPFDMETLAERTIVVSSISKSHAVPGFRSGWAIGPAAFCDRLLPLSETMLFGGQPFIADMTAHALNNTFDTADKMRAAYQRRAKLVVEALSASNTIKPMMPDAGMFILLDVSHSGLSGEKFAWGLLEKHYVATMPGPSFGNQANGFIRLSLTVPDKKLKEACNRIAEFAANA